MSRSISASMTLAFLLIALPSMASEEEYLAWSSLRLECKESPQAGKVTVFATMGDAGLSSFQLTAFGKDHSLAASDLAKVRDFPLDSLRVTHEAGYPQLGGHTVHFKLSRSYYVPAQMKSVAEDVVISVSKGKGLSVSGPHRR